MAILVHQSSNHNESLIIPPTKPEQPIHNPSAIIYIPISLSPHSTTEPHSSTPAIKYSATKSQSQPRKNKQLSTPKGIGKPKVKAQAQAKVKAKPKQPRAGKLCLLIPPASTLGIVQGGIGDHVKEAVVVRDVGHATNEQEVVDGTAIDVDDPALNILRGTPPITPPYSKKSTSPSSSTSRASPYTRLTSASAHSVPNIPLTSHLHRQLQRTSHSKPFLCSSPSPHIYSCSRVYGSGYGFPESDTRTKFGSISVSRSSEFPVGEEEDDGAGRDGGGYRHGAKNGYESGWMSVEVSWGNDVDAPTTGGSTTSTEIISSFMRRVQPGKIATAASPTYPAQKTAVTTNHSPADGSNLIVIPEEGGKVTSDDYGNGSKVSDVCEIVTKQEHSGRADKAGAMSIGQVGMKEEIEKPSVQGRMTRSMTKTANEANAQAGTEMETGPEMETNTGGGETDLDPTTRTTTSSTFARTPTPVPMSVRCWNGSDMTVEIDRASTNGLSSDTATTFEYQHQLRMSPQARAPHPQLHHSGIRISKRARKARLMEKYKTMPMLNMSVSDIRSRPVNHYTREIIMTPPASTTSSRSSSATFFNSPSPSITSSSNVFVQRPWDNPVPISVYLRSRYHLVGSSRGRCYGIVLAEDVADLDVTFATGPIKD